MRENRLCQAIQCIYHTNTSVQWLNMGSPMSNVIKRLEAFHRRSIDNSRRDQVPSSHFKNSELYSTHQLPAPWGNHCESRGTPQAALWPCAIHRVLEAMYQRDAKYLTDGTYFDNLHLPTDTSYADAVDFLSTLGELSLQS